jgi:NADH-quinone oxidoreductase subunit G
MVIHTNTSSLEKTRKGILELLLINHPLDCPICDQGGECDLQDISHHYGPNQSRFELNKRAVPNKDIGPFIKTVMNRCIHCTRCIRFAKEIAGVPELGAIGRGEHTEIISYLEQSLTSELSGNLIDICPVGALTNKPMAFYGRPWELKKTATIDLMDALGSHIQIDSHNENIVRVLPRPCDEINEVWISDLTRFSYDGLKYQRIDQPYKRVGNKLQPCTWDEALSVVVEKLQSTHPSQIAGLVGNLCDIESVYLLKKIFKALGSPYTECRLENALIPHEARWQYLLNSKIPGFEKTDALLILGSNPRIEAPLLNARIRKNFLKHSIPIALWDEKPHAMTYDYTHLGSDFQTFHTIKNDPWIKKHFAHAEFPSILIGASAFRFPIEQTLNHLIEGYQLIREGWNGYNVLHSAASRVGAIDLEFIYPYGGLETILKKCEQNDMKVLFSLGADEVPLERLGKTFLIYQGHHGDVMAQRADVVLPSCAYTEKSGLYTNTEGRNQMTQPVVKGPEQAREDWFILNQILHALSVTHFSSIQTLREQIFQEYPVLQDEDYALPSQGYEPLQEQNEDNFSFIPDNPSFSHEFHRRNTIARHSILMNSHVSIPQRS